LLGFAVNFRNKFMIHHNHIFIICLQSQLSVNIFLKSVQALHSLNPNFIIENQARSLSHIMSSWSIFNIKRVLFRQNPWDGTAKGVNKIPITRFWIFHDSYVRSCLLNMFQRNPTCIPLYNVSTSSSPYTLRYFRNLYSNNLKSTIPFYI
jgi:hypothetical protein